MYQQKQLITYLYHQRRYQRGLGSVLVISDVYLFSRLLFLAILTSDWIPNLKSTWTTLGLPGWPWQMVGIKQHKGSVYSFVRYFVIDVGDGLRFGVISSMAVALIAEMPQPPSVMLCRATRPNMASRPTAPF